MFLLDWTTIATERMEFLGGFSQELGRVRAECEGSEDREEGEEGCFFLEGPHTVPSIIVSTEP